MLPGLGVSPRLFFLSPEEWGIKGVDKTQVGELVAGTSIGARP